VDPSRRLKTPESETKVSLLLPFYYKSSRNYNSMGVRVSSFSSVPSVHITHKRQVIVADAVGCLTGEEL
jgi:hypothetical protein